MRKLFERTILFVMVGALALAALPATAQETVGSTEVLNAWRGAGGVVILITVVMS